MEFAYNVLSSLSLLVIVWGIIGLINPKLYSKLLKEHANRKSIALLTVGLFLSLAIVAATLEPESVKRERIQSEKNSKSLSAKQEGGEHNAEERSEVSAVTEQVDPSQYWHRVVRIVDGDTVVANVDGKDVSIRIIGINSPESTNRTECFGIEASNKAKEFLTGKWIQLERDESQSERDKYNRLLRYVWFDNGTDFGRRMIEEGFANEYTYNTPYNKQAQYKETQTAAKERGRGLWSAKTCAGSKDIPKPKAVSTPQPTPTPSPRQSTPAPAPSSDGVVKMSKSGICHAPGTTYYNRTTNYTGFDSLDACLNAGGRLPLR